MILSVAIPMLGHNAISGIHDMITPGRTAPLVRFILLTGVLLAITVVSASAEEIVFWVPNSISTDDLIPSPNIYYAGLAGRLLGVEPEVSDLMITRGGQKLDIRRSDDGLYVFLVADAKRAVFENVTKILVRSGHEVLAVTSGEAPRLTAASEAELPGLRQPVHISWVARPRPPARPHAPVQFREANPFVQQMIDALTEPQFMVTWQALEDFITRYTYAPENELATQWILDQFLSFGLDAEFHTYWQDGPRQNVIATLPGMVDPTKVVYFVAHFDSRSEAPYECAPGADDNGSGTAAVIEAARVMSQYLFDYTMKFACFNGEEQGLRGSAAYVADIAAAGEDVIAAYNADMIAYRGTDPAPPDMIIYTDPASTLLATTLHDATQTYLPDVLEPIVIHESVGMSDHESFWTHGYPAVFVIESEVFGGDFCPWYHTCADSIANYPQDYVVNCAKANLAGVATMAQPFDLNGPALVLDGIQVDDDPVGSSNGDGDGTINLGETIELWITLHNAGNTPATTVTGELTSVGGPATILTANASWNDIPPDGEDTNLTSFVFELEGAPANGDELLFTLIVTDQTGSRPINFDLSISMPVLAYYFSQVDDLTSGDGNGVVDPGEILYLSTMLTNTGSKEAVDVEAVLSSDDPLVVVLDAVAGAEMIGVGLPAELSPAYRIQVSDGAVVGDVLELDLAISEGTFYETICGFKLKVGTLFFDDVERDGAWSLAADDDDATTGLWVRVDPIGTMMGWQQVQPEDDHTPHPGTDCFVTGQHIPEFGPGSTDVDGGKTTLTSPMFDVTIPGEPWLTYWRWYSNNLSGHPGEDTLVVQISNDAGLSWIDLERTQQSENFWRSHSFLIADYVVPTDQVLVRFIASDYGGGSLVEAAVDDFEIGIGPDPMSIGESPQPLVLSLGHAYPNPFQTQSRIAFSIHHNGCICLALYDVSGRLVRTLVDSRLGIGVHGVTWDGLNNAGTRVASGVYYYRLDAGESALSQRLVVVR